MKQLAQAINAGWTDAQDFDLSFLAEACWEDQHDFRLLSGHEFEEKVVTVPIGTAYSITRFHTYIKRVRCTRCDTDQIYREHYSSETFFSPDGQYLYRVLSCPSDDGWEYENQIEVSQVGLNRLEKLLEEQGAQTFLAKGLRTTIHSLRHMKAVEGLEDPIAFIINDEQALFDLFYS